MSSNSLIDKIGTGDYNELELIYKKYRTEFIRWICKSNTCTLEDAKDIYQQTILIFYENIVNEKVIKLNCSIKTYIFAIGRNKMSELLRDKGRFTEEVYIATNMTVGDTLDFDDNMQESKGVEKCLKILGNPCKKILELYYYHKKSMRDISIEMGFKNAETVKNLKYKCMKRLRTIYEKEMCFKVSKK